MSRSDGVFVSVRAEIGERVRFGTGVKIYGQVVIGDGCWLDSGVIIGYPGANEVRVERLASDSAKEGLDQVLDKIASGVTRIGPDSFVRSGTVIYAGSSAGERLDCAHHVVVRECCNLGVGVELGPFAYMKRACVVGDYSRVAAEICDRTIVGRYCTVYGRTSHKFLSGISGVVEDAPVLEDGVVIGREAVVIGSVRLGELSFVGAGAVVTQSVPTETVVAGNPARPVRSRTRDEAPDLWARVRPA